MSAAGFFRRWRWSLLVAGLLLLGLGYAFWPEAVPVDTATVSRGAMVVGVTDDGVTRAREYYVVSAPVTGYLQRIELEAGDRVERGAGRAGPGPGRSHPHRRRTRARHRRGRRCRGAGAHACQRRGALGDHRERGRHP